MLDDAFLANHLEIELDELHLHPHAPAYSLHSWETREGPRVARELAEVLQALDLFPVYFQDRGLDVSGKLFGVGPVNI